MTIHPHNLHLLPGGQRTVPLVPIVEAMLPFATRIATDDWAETLSEAELTELVEQHVLLPIQTSAWGLLESPEWRKVADVLLSEVMRRREASSPAEPSPAEHLRRDARWAYVVQMAGLLAVLLGGLLLLLGR